MAKEQKKAQMLQWHPAFYAGIQIEFSEEADKLFKHLSAVRHLCLEEQEEGIYRVSGDIFPVQIVCASKLPPERNLWLRSLTNDLEQGRTMDSLLKEYRRYRKNVLYKSVMNLIIRANRELFEEEKGNMCEALRELFKEELEVGIAAGIEERMPKIIEERVAEAVEERVAEVVEERVEERVAEVVEERVEARVAEVVEERVAEAKKNICQELRREGINALIADNIEEGFSVGRILEKLEKRFGLTAKEAQGYMEQFTAG